MYEFFAHQSKGNILKLPGEQKVYLGKELKM